MKKIILLSLIFILNIIFICSAQNLNDREINTELNSEYINSKKSYLGKLTSEELIEVRNAFETELNTKIPENKSILINFFQYGKNCIVYRFNNETKENVANNCIRLSSEISNHYNAIDFFVYTEDALDKSIYAKREKFILDSGFFQKTVFTLQENCRAFFILKSNGEFLKYYGEDYYSEVINFLEKIK